MRIDEFGECPLFAAAEPLQQRALIWNRALNRERVCCVLSTGDVDPSVVGGATARERYIGV